MTMRTLLTLLLSLICSPAFAQILINGSTEPQTVSGRFKIRVESSEPMENCMLYISGVLTGQTYDRPGPNRHGTLIEPDGLALEFDVDSAIFPYGIHTIFVSTWRQVTATLIAEYQTEVTFDNSFQLDSGQVTFDRPQFGRDGKLYYKHEANSIIPRVMFGGNVEEFKQRPGLIDQYKAAGFNCIFTGIGINSVRDIPGCNQAQFEAAQQVRIDAAKSFCEQHGVKAIADMMDWTWNQDSALAMLQPPWIDDAMKNTFTRMVEAGCFICCDLCDETEFRWTPDQQLQARRFSDAAWLAKMPVSWTTLPIAQEFMTYRNELWAQGAYFSDYLSLGRDVVDWRVPPVPSVDSYYRAMFGAAYRIRTDCPSILNLTCSGEIIGDYHTLSEAGFALTLGSAGLKVYHLDVLDWKNHRAINPTSIYVQYGCDPETYPLRWAAMSHAMNAIAELEPLLLQPRVACESGGKWFATAAFEGKNGRLWLGVNRLDRENRAVVPNGYKSGFVLGVNGKTAVSGRKQFVTVPAGGWLVMKG